MKSNLDDASATALLARQAALQASAANVLSSLGLVRVLAPLGQPMVVGSVMTGLMVWPDIDLNVLCPEPDPVRIWTAIRPLVSHPWVKKLRWTNERGASNRTGQPQDDGYYLGIHAHTEGTNAGEQWNLDCWFLPSDAPRPEIELMNRLQRDLTEETLLAILWIKDVWHRLPAYRDTVISVDIYEAVLDHDVRTPDAFAQWLKVWRGP